MVSLSNRKMVLLVATLFIFGSLVMACAPDEEEAEPVEPSVKDVTEGGTLTIAISEEPDTLDVHKSGAAVVNTVSSNLGASLVNQDPETLDFEPGLAESWETSDDGLVWTFHLRDDVVFHNGESFTASDIKFTFERAIDPDTEAGLVGSLLDPVEKVEVIDEHIVEVVLSEPFGPFLQYMTFSGWLQPLSEKAVTEAGDDYGRNPVGLGPFEFQDWVTGQEIVFSRNEDYSWPPSYYENRGSPYIDTLRYRVVSERETRLAALETGEIDIAAIDGRDIDRFQEQGFEIHEQLRDGLGMFLIFNLQSEPLQDINLRQAINLAINKDAVIQAALAGHGIKSYSPLPPSIWSYDESTEEYGYHQDKDEAVRLLEEAGYRREGDGEYLRTPDGDELELNLYTMPTEAWTTTAELVQADLRDIGVNVEITMLEWGSLMESLSAGDHDMATMGYTYDDPDVLHLFLHSSQEGDGINWSFHRYERLDELLAEGRTTVEPEERRAVYEEIQEFVIEEAIWAPIYTNYVFTAVNPRVEGFFIHKIHAHQLHDIWLSE